ncbi:MAG: hypothetical protein ABDH28_04315 [Brevinematia bacterium]
MDKKKTTSFYLLDDTKRVIARLSKIANVKQSELINTIAGLLDKDEKLRIRVFEEIRRQKEEALKEGWK